MKNILMIAFAVMIAPCVAYAACTETTTTKSYTACKKEYYKSGTSCQPCPTILARKQSESIIANLFAEKVGLSADRNTNGIVACYLPQCSDTAVNINSGGITTRAVGTGFDRPIVTESCYEYQDDTGIFTLTADCYYKI